MSISRDSPRCLEMRFGSRRALVPCSYATVAPRRRMYLSSDYCDSACNCISVWVLELMTRRYARFFWCSAIVAWLAACGQANPTVDAAQPQTVTAAGAGTDVVT